MSTDYPHRHQSTQAAMRRLEVNPNIPEYARAIAEWYRELGDQLLTVLDDDPDLSDSLRKLWESKNCAVYCSVRAHQAEQ